MNSQQINAECQRLYEEIKLLMEQVGWRPLQMARKVTAKLSKLEIKGYEEKSKSYERIKKMLSRRNWENGKARQETLELLNEIRQTIEHHDDYHDALIKFESIGLDDDDDEQARIDGSKAVARARAQIRLAVKEVEARRGKI